MSSREVQADDNLLSAFALMIGGALVVGFPMAFSDHLGLLLTKGPWCPMYPGGCEPWIYLGPSLRPVTLAITLSLTGW